MKTPLEELIENWEKFKPTGTPTESIWNAFIDDAKKALTKEKMSKEEIIESLKDILDEINETPKDSFVDITYIKETIQDILNQNKDE